MHTCGGGRACVLCCARLLRACRVVVRCSMLQCTMHAVLYCTVLCTTPHRVHCAALHCIALPSVLRCTVCAVLHRTMCAAPHLTVLCTALHCALCCTALCCSVLCSALHVCAAQGGGNAAHHHARLHRVEGLGLHPCALCTSAQGAGYGGCGVSAANPRPVTSRGVMEGAAPAAPKPQHTYHSLCCPCFAATATSQPLRSQPLPRYQSRGYGGAAIAAPRPQPTFCRCIAAALAPQLHCSTPSPRYHRGPMGLPQ